MTIKSIIFSVATFCIASLSCSDGFDTFPDWLALESRLLNEPNVVLKQLENTDISVWSDRQKVQYFNVLSDAYLIFSAYESAEKALQQAVLLKDSADPYTLINIITTKTYFKELEGDLVAAETEYLSALRVAEQSGSADAIILALESLINFYSLTNDDYGVALEYVERASALSQQVTREFLVGDLHNAYGSIMSYLGDTDAAFDQYGVAESIYLKHSNNVSLSTLTYNQAMLHEEAEDYISSLRAYQQFIEKAEKWGDPAAPFFGHMGMANNYSYLERFDQAYESVLKAESAIEYVVDSFYLFDFWNSVIYIASDK